jgi:hypothetical protein
METDSHVDYVYVGPIGSRGVPSRPVATGCLAPIQLMYHASMIWSEPKVSVS